METLGWALLAIVVTVAITLGVTAAKRMDRPVREESDRDAKRWNDRTNGTGA